MCPPSSSRKRRKAAGPSTATFVEPDTEIFQHGSDERGYTPSIVSEELQYNRTYIHRCWDPSLGLDVERPSDQLDAVLSALQLFPDHTSRMEDDKDAAALWTWVKNKAMRNRGDGRTREETARDNVSRDSAGAFTFWDMILEHETVYAPPPSIVPGSLNVHDGYGTVEEGAGPYCKLTDRALSRLNAWFSHLDAREETCRACCEYHSAQCFIPTEANKNSCVHGNQFARLMVPKSLESTQWLDDEIINGYLGLVETRSKSEAWRRAGGAKVLAFSSHFYSKLMQGGQYNYGEEISAWLRNEDVLEYDYVFVPINHSNTHWSLCVVYVSRLVIQHLDSMPATKDNFCEDGRSVVEDECSENIRSWFAERVRRNKKRTQTKISVRVDSLGDAPRQTNNCDCGVFVCKYADFVSKDLPLDFSQKHMPYFRARIADELLVGFVS